jgi:hypothetical protein
MVHEGIHGFEAGLKRGIRLGGLEGKRGKQKLKFDDPK